MSETEDKNKIWGLVHIGPLTFLGAFCGYRVIDSADAQLPLANVLEQIDNDLKAGEVVCLMPVMELQAPLQQVRQQTPNGGERVGIAKSPLPMPYGFTTGKTALRVLKPNAWTFINEMSEGDQKIYRGFIDTVLKAELEERVSRSGLTLPTVNGVSRG